MAPAKQSTAEIFRNIQRPYHRTGENRSIVNKNHKAPECSNGYRQKNLGNSLHLAPNSRQHKHRRPILYSLYFQTQINSLFLILTRCNQFFIVNNNKVQLILYSLHRKSVINSLFFILSKCD